MRSINKLYIFLCGLLFILNPFICSAQNQEAVSTVLFQGEINTNNINIRSDSTVASKIICIANKAEPVEVIKESYEWYKIRLPKTAPSFIRKNLVSLIDDKTAKVLKDNVNIRLQPSESSAILGRAGKNEVINIAGEEGEWYKIEPLNNSFGWVNKKFVDKSEITNRREADKLSKEAPGDESVTVEGILRPYGKVIRRVATHKLIANDNKVFLLKGNKENLDSLNYRKVRITGKSIDPKGQEYTTIKILKIETLD